LDFVATHKSIIEEANEQNMQLISEEKELLDQIIRKQLAIASSLFTKVAYSRFEPKNYEYLKSVNSNFLKHSWEFILGKNTSSAGIGEIKILNFRKFLKIINKTKNIESFGDYSHVFMSDEDEPRVLAKLMIDEDEKVLRIEEISENSSALVLSFLKTKASDFVDVKDIQTSPSNSFKSFKSSEIPNLAEELNLPGSLFDNINSPEDLIRAIELDVARKQKLLLGFVSEDFGFPIISYFARQDGGLKAMWKEFAINKPSRTKLLDSKSYLGVFLEYILTEISFQDKSSTIPMVERIIQKKKSIMKKEVIDFYRAIMKADYLLFKIENYDQATNDFIIRDLNTDSLLPAQHLDNPIALFEPGKIFVAKKVTWNQKNVLTYFLLSYPANYRKKLQKLFNEKSEEILFSDSNLVRFSDRLIELHCESQNANLGEFPLK
ncbi:MAG: hypothetical protein JJT78_00585, partial [Leptospira sp.]|nr:hypothetical protein [Leptospira sp.]